MATISLRSLVAGCMLLHSVACSGDSDGRASDDVLLPDRNEGSRQPVLQPWAAVEPGRDFAWGPDPDVVLLGNAVADLANDRLLYSCGLPGADDDPFGVAPFWIRDGSMYVLGYLNTSGPSGIAITSCPLVEVDPLLLPDQGGGPPSDAVVTTFLTYEGGPMSLDARPLQVREDGVVLSSCFAGQGPEPGPVCGTFFVSYDGSVLPLLAVDRAEDLGAFVDRSGALFHAAYADLFEADRHRQAQRIVISRVSDASPPTLEPVAEVGGPFVLRDRTRPYHVTDRGLAVAVQVSTGPGAWEDRLLVVDLAGDVRLEVSASDAGFALPASEPGTVQPDLFGSDPSWLLLPAAPGFGAFVAVELTTGVTVETLIDPQYLMGRSPAGVDVRASGNVVVDGGADPAQGGSSDPLHGGASGPRTNIRGMIDVRRPLSTADAAAYARAMQGWDGHGETPPGADVDWTFQQFTSGPNEPCDWNDTCERMVGTGWHFAGGDSLVWLFVDGARESRPGEYSAGQTPQPYRSWEQLWWVDGAAGSAARVLASGAAIDRDLLRRAREPWFAVRMLGDDTGTESTHADTLTGWHVRRGVATPAFDRQRYVFPRWGALDGALVWGHRGYYRLRAPD